MKKQKKTIKEIKEAIPNLEDEKVFDLSNSLDSILAVKRIFSSEDGQILIDVIRNNCFIALNKLIMKAKNEPKLDELLALIFTYSANLDLLATMQDIGMEEEIRNQLDEAVKEAANKIT